MAGLNIAGLVWLSCLLLTSPSAGAEARQSLKLVAHILPRASLRLSQDQITFVGYEDQAVIPSQEGPVQVTVKGRPALVLPWSYLWGRPAAWKAQKPVSHAGELHCELNNPTGFTPGDYTGTVVLTLMSP